MMRHVHLAADSDSRIEIQFTRERRALELAIAFVTRREDLVLAPVNRRQFTAIEKQLRRLVAIAAKHPSPNRQLSAHDLTLLYAVVTRDRDLAENAQQAFQRVSSAIGGYANLADRFNSRVHAARKLWTGFRDLPEVGRPADPLRNPHATPHYPTGLLVRPTIRP